MPTIYSISVDLDRLVLELALERDSLARLDVRTRIVLLCGQAEAFRYNHRAIEPAHLFLGILKENASRAALTLKRTGIEIRLARTAVQKMILPKPDAPSLPLPFAPTAMRVVGSACQAARSRIVGADDLLESLLRQERACIERIFRYSGVDSKNLFRAFTSQPASSPADSGRTTSPGGLRSP